MRANLKSQIADLVNAADGQGGAITAALYLSEFIVPPKTTTPTATTTTSISKSSDNSKSEPSLNPSTSVDQGSNNQGGDNPDSDSNDNDNDNSSSSGGGSGQKMTWIHVDFPGAPLGLRAVYQFIKTMKR